MEISRATRTLTVLAAIAAATMAGCGGPEPEALLASGKDYLAKNDRNAAVIQFKNALQQNPRFAEARFLLGKALLESGDFAAAEKDLRKAMEYNYPAEEVIPPLARSLAVLGRHKEVIDEFSKAEIANPVGKAELQAALGRAFLGVGDAKTAERA